MKTFDERSRELDAMADEFETKGGDRAKFWAGQMAASMAGVRNGGILQHLMRHIDRCNFAARRYDTVIFSRVGND